MSDKKILENIKKLREITGVGFSDCKLAITEDRPIMLDYWADSHEKKNCNRSKR